jgi:hypothetical protein
VNSFGNLLIAAFATWSIVEIWHHSSIMATWRAKTQLWENKLGELLACPFCLSVWVGFVTAGIMYIDLPAATNNDLFVSPFGWLLVLATLGWWGVAAFLSMSCYEHYTLTNDKSAFRSMWFFVGGIVASLVLAVVLAVTVLPAGAMLGVWYVTVLVAKVLTVGFAVARLANLGNDLTHKWCRTPRDKTPEDLTEKPMVLNITVNQQAPKPKTTFEKDGHTDEQRLDPDAHAGTTPDVR